MKHLTTAQFVQNWQNGMRGAGAAYQAGINGVTESPMQKAASPQARQKYAQNTQQAAQDGGRMETGLNRVTLEGWKRQAAGVGAANLVTGATKGGPKMQAVAAQLIAAQQAGSAAAAAVQGTSAKMMANINAMRSAFGKPPLA